MLIVMSHNATTADIDAVVRAVAEMGFTAAPIPGRERTAIPADIVHRQFDHLCDQYPVHAYGWIRPARMA